MNDPKLKEQEQATSELYGSLFTAYDQKRFEESVELFEMRHKRWGIPLEWFSGKTCLDGGCGGGRFVVALAKLGAERVEGIDISEDAVAAARARSNRFRSRYPVCRQDVRLCYFFRRGSPHV